MKRLLLIEDDAWLADSYVRLFRAAGYRVSWCANGDAAMRALEKRVAEVIVADVMLEGHTIFSLLHELQSYDDTARIPVILCSTLDFVHTNQPDLASYGVVSVLDKATLTPENMLLHVREAIS